MLDKVIATIDGGGMIAADDHVLLALSGGADSMALFSVLVRLQGKRGFALSVAHYHHGIRGSAADMDAAFAREMARDFGVDYYEERGDVPAAAAEQGNSIEQQARVMRYEFLERTAGRIGATRIATAHHMDDQAETVLFRIGRGAGGRGAIGMRAVRGIYIRPLIRVRRSEIEAYLTERGIPWCDDETNADEAYTRNALRRIIGELEGIIPGFVGNVNRFAQLMDEDEQALSALALSLFEEAVEGGGLRILALRAAQKAVASRAVRLLCAQEGLRYDVEKAHIDAMLALRETGKTVTLPHGYQARNSYGVLVIGKAEQDTAYFEEPLATEGETATPRGAFAVRRIDRPADMTPPDALTIYASEAALVGAYARPRREGDRILAFGGRHKKLKKAYIDAKIDRMQREWPVLANDDEVLWAPGVVVSERLRVSDDETTVLQVAFAPTAT